MHFEWTSARHELENANENRGGRFTSQESLPLRSTEFQIILQRPPRSWENDNRTCASLTMTSPSHANASLLEPPRARLRQDRQSALSESHRPAAKIDSASRRTRKGLVLDSVDETLRCSVRGQSLVPSDEHGYRLFRGGNCSASVLALTFILNLERVMVKV